MRGILAEEMNDINTVNEIKKELIDSNFLYITVTQNMTDLRINTDELSPYFKNGEKQNIFSVVELIRLCTQRVYSQNRFISNGDQRYILDKLFGWYFKDSPNLINLYSSLKYKLFELYDFLLSTDTPAIPNNVLENIEKDFSIREKEIFILYNYYLQIIRDICEGNKSELIAACGLRLNLRRRNIHTFRQKVQAELLSVLIQYDKIIMDGFVVTSNEYENYIIKATQQNKIDLFMILKNIFEYQEKPFFDFLKDSNPDITFVHAFNPVPPPKTALNDLKNRFLHPVAKTVLVPDDQSVMITSFCNRAQEFRFVAEGISSLVRELGEDATLEEIRTFLKENVAIVLAMKKFDRRIDSVFREIGAFVYKESDENANIYDMDSFRRIYYSRSEFLADTPRYRNGQPFSYEEKLRFFTLNFYRLGIEKKERPVIDYPVVQYIVSLYSCIKEGMSVEQFRLLLNSDWDYIIRNSSDKYDQYIADFDNISVYLENKPSVEEWIDTIQEILSSRETMRGNPIYQYHPFYTVAEESLCFLLNLLISLSNILKVLAGVEGGIVEHFRVLNEQVLQLTKLKALSPDEYTLEQTVVAKLGQIIKDITSGSIIENLDANYFARNLKALLEDYTHETDDMGIIRVNVAHLLNMRSYRYTWFPVCEDDKYPRIFEEQYPYTEPILQILQNPKFKINRTPVGIHTMDAHLQFQRRILKNVIGFTKERIIVSYSDKEAGDYKNPSIFIEDIYSALNRDATQQIDKRGTQTSETLFTGTVCSPSLPGSGNNTFTVTELLTYLLCPKLYYYRYIGHRGKVPYRGRYQLRLYAEAILYCDTLRRAATVCEQDKIVFSACDSGLCSLLKDCLKNSMSQILPYFGFLSQMNIRDIEVNVMKKLASHLVSDAIRYRKFSHFTVCAEPVKTIRCNGYDLLLEYDTRISGYGVPENIPKNRSTIRQSRNYADFLVQKSNYNIVGTDLEHYQDMMDCLHKNPRGLDRLGMILKMQRKINVQFDTRFAKDGVKRADYLVNELRAANFIKLGCIPSDYCTYCSIGDICKGH